MSPRRRGRPPYPRGVDLRGARRASGLGLRSAAGACGVPPSTWHRWEVTGAVPPDELGRVLAVLAGARMGRGRAGEAPAAPVVQG